MNEQEYQRGVSEAEADIAGNTCRLFFQTRGKWGELFTDLMQEQFAVRVVHISDITDDNKKSYEHGFNSTIRGHLGGKFGAGAYERVWTEVEAFRQETYRRVFDPPADDS